MGFETYGSVLLPPQPWEGDIGRVGEDGCTRFSNGDQGLGTGRLAPRPSRVDNPNQTEKEAGEAEDPPLRPRSVFREGGSIKINRWFQTLVTRE